MGLDIIVVGILYTYWVIVARDENICPHPVLPHVSLLTIPTSQKVSNPCPRAIVFKILKLTL